MEKIKIGSKVFSIFHVGNDISLPQCIEQVGYYRKSEIGFNYWYNRPLPLSHTVAMWRIRYKSLNKEKW